MININTIYVLGAEEMKKWKKEININVPIEFAWSYFYGDVEKKKKIFPKVVEEEYHGTNGASNWIRYPSDVSKWFINGTI